MVLHCDRLGPWDKIEMCCVPVGNFTSTLTVQTAWKTAMLFGGIRITSTCMVLVNLRMCSFT